MAIKQKNIHKNNTAPGYRLPGVAATAALYLLLENRSAAVEGDLWYDTTNNILKTYDGSGWSAAGLQSQSAGSLNNAASIGGTITVDGSTVSNDFAVTVSNNGNDVCATFTQNDTTNNPKGLVLVNTGSAITLDFTSSGTYDVQGTGDTWDITAAGHADFATGIGIDADSQTLTFGDSDDITMQFIDGWSGAAGTGLLIASSQSTDQLQIGDSTYAFDVRIFGSTNTNLVLWDASANALIFDNCDVQLGDADKVSFGDSQDFELYHTNASPDRLTLAGANLQFDIGTSGASMDVYWHTEATGDHVYFDEDNAVVDFVDVDIMIDDSADIYFGSDDDWAFGGTTALVLLAAQDNQTFTVGNVGGTIGSDLLWYTGTAAAGFFIDASLDKVYLDKADFHLGDDDYLVLGDSGTAGSSSDATIRWDNSNSELEIIGNTRIQGTLDCDSTVDITSDLVVGGSFTLTGGFNPGDLTLTDDETFAWGSSDDITMTYNGTSDAFVIEGANEGTSIEIGYTNSQDFNLYGDTNSAFIKYDGTSNALMVEGTDIIMMDDDIIEFGDSKEFSVYYDENTTDRLILAASVADDAVQIGDGTIATDFIVQNTTNASAYIQWDDSAEIWYFGQTNHGVDVLFCGDTSGYDALWDETANGMVFKDNAILAIGNTVASPDYKLTSNGTTGSATLGANFLVSGAYTYEFGVTSGNGTDVVFQGVSHANDSITFDSGEGRMAFGTFGGVTTATDGIDVVFQAHDTTDDNPVTFDSGAASWTFGATSVNGIDVVFQGVNQNENQVTWDAGTEIWTFGGTVGNGIDVIFQGTTTNAMRTTWDAGAETWTFGASRNNGVDVTFKGVSGANDNVTWDAGDSLWTFGGTSTNSVDVVFQGQTTAQQQVKWDGGAETWVFGATANNGVDVTFQGASDANDTVVFDAGAHSWTFGAAAATGADGVDVVFQGVSATAGAITWDAGAQTWLAGAGTNSQFKGDTTQATITKGLCIPLVSAAPTTTSAAPAAGTALVCYYEEGDGTSGSLYVKTGATGSWVAVAAG